MRILLRTRKGQNLVEYLILIAAVSVVLIAAVAKNTPFSSQVNAFIYYPANMIEQRNQEIRLEPAP